MGWFFATILISLFSLPLFAIELPSDGCGEKIVHHSIIIPNGKFDFQLDATAELRFRQEQVATATALIEKSHAQFAQAFKWFNVFLNGYQKSLATSEGEPVSKEVQAIGDGNNDLNAAIEQHLAQLKPERRAEEVLTYFGAHYPGVSGPRLKNLVNALLIQEYVARFQARLLERIALELPIEQNLFGASADFIAPRASEVLQELSKPHRDYPHIAKLPRGIPVRTYGVSAGEASTVEEAYVKADRLALESAIAKGRALSLDSSVPDVLRNFMQHQDVSMRAFPAHYVHPILIDWVVQVEQFLSPDRN